MSIKSVWQRKIVKMDVCNTRNGRIRSIIICEKVRVVPVED
jgi:hypothetical protein